MVSRKRRHLTQATTAAVLAALALWLGRAAAEDTGDLPDAWAFPGPPPVIHIAKGMWWDVYRIPLGGALMGGAHYRVSYSRSSGAIPGFPRTYGELLRHNVIVIANCHANAFKGPRKWLIALGN